MDENRIFLILLSSLFGHLYRVEAKVENRFYEHIAPRPREYFLKNCRSYFILSSPQNSIEEGHRLCNYGYRKIRKKKHTEAERFFKMALEKDEGMIGPGWCLIF